MKKILIGLASVLITVSANAQGFVTFNNIGNPINSVVTGAALGTGYTVELVVGGNVLASTPIVGGGTFLGANPVDIGAGEVAVTIRAYPDSFGSYDDALVRGDVDHEVLMGATFNTTGGNSLASPPEVPAALGFPGGTTTVVPAIPEPSTIALGILGLGALALRRRRNA